MSNTNRIIIAAPKSGSGKTMITCGLITALKNRGLKVCSMKCGPDYIDPMYHRRALGVEAGNLDSFFLDSDTLKNNLLKHIKRNNADICVIEGVMGYYDGLAGVSTEGSTYDIASKTHTNVILVIDIKGMSASVSPLISGLLAYKNDNGISGVILNRCSDSIYSRLKGLVEEECGVKVLGYMPDIKNVSVPSRHLGLLNPEEIDDFSEWAERISGQIEKTIDVQAIIELSETAVDIDEEIDDASDIKAQDVKDSKVTIAVARDEAFSFYYDENIDFLKQNGAKIVYFSPIHDQHLPKEIDGLILGGGYPELYAGALSENVSMRNDIRVMIDNKLPFLAECGGYMYLQDSLVDSKGDRHEMVGFFHGEASPVGGLRRFGYVEMTTSIPGVLGDKGTVLRGHEFHHWDCTDNGNSFIAVKPMTDVSYLCEKYSETYAAGFVHLFYENNPVAIRNWLDRCLYYRSGRLTKAKWDSIAKPIDGLGKLEDLVCKINSIRRDYANSKIGDSALVVMCADHGVVSEGVTQTDSSVTQVVSENVAKGASSVAIMAKYNGMQVYSVDIGMCCDRYPDKELKAGSVIDRKIRPGTDNLAVSDAMTFDDCEKAIEVGIDIVRELSENGIGVIATGEMGIGNTTPTSALCAAILDITPEAATGRGAGLDDKGYIKKIDVVNKAKNRVKDILDKINSSEEPVLYEDIIKFVASIGGFEIAGMIGIYLGGFKYNIPIIMDGAISCVSALCASMMDIRVKDYIIPSHLSTDGATKLVMDRLEMDPIIHGNMRLGEGTGAVALMPLLNMAFEVFSNMPTFDDIQIDKYERK